jgi:predicted enzyme related to lactoylglutathione lyase
MDFQLEHVAIYTKDIGQSIKFYEKFFGGQATPIRTGSAGYGFCFVRIAGAPSIQLMESAGQVGVHHYGYVTDDIDRAAKEFKEKGAEILRENRDDLGRLTTIFVKDPNGLEMEIRSPR